MPAYDYKCSVCGAVFEAEHGMAVQPKVKCVKCGSLRTAKLFNAAGVHFTGSGFYVTDSRPKPAEGKAESGLSKPDSKPDVVPAGTETEKTEAPSSSSSHNKSGAKPEKKATAAPVK